MRMVQSRAGTAAINKVHQGFSPNGLMNQPLLGSVGCQKIKKKESFRLLLYEIPIAQTVCIPRNAKGSERTGLHLGMYGELFANTVTRILPTPRQVVV